MLKAKLQSENKATTLSNVLFNARHSADVNDNSYLIGLLRGDIFGHSLHRGPIQSLKRDRLILYPNVLRYRTN